MVNNDISTFEKILIEIRDVIQESEEFKGIEVYFDDSEMNPNISLPAISFKISGKEVLNESVTCREYSRRMEIRLHTETLDKRDLQSELYKFEEDLIHVLNNAMINGNLGTFYEIRETGASGINALMFNAKKEANQFNMTFFSNLLRIRFVIRYSI